jgi:RNA polymerase sigma factor (sigma-70 family)
MSHDTTQPSLLSRVRDLEDQSAWRDFDAQYRDLILRYCLRRGLQRSDAEDVRQMVMLNLAKHLRSFEYEPSKGRFRDYLGRVVRNAIHRYFRSPKGELAGLRTSVASAVPDDSEDLLDRTWDDEWTQHHFRLAMAAVRRTADPQSIEVFERLLSGETTDAVAAALGMSRDAVHKVKQRIRDRLKEHVARQVHEEAVLDDGPDA